MELEGNPAPLSYQGVANVFHFPHSVPIPAIMWDQLTGETRYICRFKAMIAWEGWTLQSVFHIASDILMDPRLC